ncbi:SPOR domain-containing protein [Waterburya agarophytonicola K14]|uniref:SPOR domain-containing protein n=1 Tax=Waterburya agarophytonicola KI4 TaxID=2874699 RepID=A0A964BQG6_9CYAN|nr:SPOR domain-containing protein [Waterburya agarophytonicola]MCC0176977.1 SPOR domain-containing protein [Waterburya agarophytonicola KI4]
MSSKRLSDRENKSSKSSANSQLKSSIVHKPFATGTINIFNPYRNKGKSKLSPSKLFLNAQLERDLDKRKTELELSELNLEPDEIEYRDRSWIDSIFSPWGISAISILFLVNLIAAGFIFRNTSNPPQVESSVTKIGNNHFGDREFMPLNLSTLGAIKTIEEDLVESTPDIIPIPPALAPLNNIASLSSFNTPYHYVLTEYTGEQSLSLARQKVKQVSLVNFPQGVFVYLGAFKNREDADKFVSQLKQNNFSAHIYPLN